MWRNSMEQRYDFKKIEKKWQKYWDEKNSFKVVEDKNKEKYYDAEIYESRATKGMSNSEQKEFLKQVH